MENGQNPPIANSRKRILLVDDYSNTASTLARAISRLKPEWDVVPATSAEEALKFDKEKTADVVITDVMMPEISGLELTEKLKSRVEGRQTAFILMSAQTTPELRESAQLLQIKQVLAKPINPESICEIILQALQETEQGEQPVTETEALS